MPCPACPCPTGATALDRKAKKKFDAEELARMGARAEARPRVPANIGLGMAKKQAQRDERALQEGIAGVRSWGGLGVGLGSAELGMGWAEVQWGWGCGGWIWP
jgi:hypothetical protein